MSPSLWINDTNKTDLGYIRPVINRFSTRMRIKFFLNDVRWFIGYKLRGWNERLDIDWWAMLGTSICFISMALVAIVLVFAFTAAFMR
jgi:hypothetical protein